MHKLLLTIMTTILLTSCAVWPLGEDPKGKELRTHANILVKAIIKYKTKNGTLPKSISDLIPNYINKLPEEMKNVYYLPMKKSLIYNYSPTWPQQGQTTCSTTIGSSKWSCHGYI